MHESAALLCKCFCESPGLIQAKRLEVHRALCEHSGRVSYYHSGGPSEVAIGVFNSPNALSVLPVVSCNPNIPLQAMFCSYKILHVQGRKLKNPSRQK